MKRSWPIGILVLLAAQVVAGRPVAAQSDSAALEAHVAKVREEYTVRRDAVLRTRLVMDERQSRAFWPLKKKFDAEMGKLNVTATALVQEFSAVYDSLNGETAAEIAERFFDLERDRLALQQKYFELISGKVSPVIAVQFIQLHRRFELEIDRMTYTPLAE